MDTTLQDQFVGRVVDGRYDVQSRIARGGMATVYLAVDRRLDRDVALKVMHDDLARDPEFVSRFVREARASARLTSPNVVQVFDQGSDGDTLYLAMEYLPGRTLRDVLAERGALTPREALSVMEPVCDALAAAHRAGIVHRDVKPENVILTDDGRIKVADFGLARAAAAPVTAGGGPDARLLGTVGYLAPELVSRGIADARADVYAAGIMLFEMLTGRQPYSGDDPVQVAYRHVHEQVPAPSAVLPALPPELDAIVLTSTEHDPDARWADGDRMLAEVKALHRSLTPEQLDVRAVAPPGYAPGETGGMAPASTHQETRALALPRNRVQQLVPRLRVHEDDDDADENWFTRDRRQGKVIIAAAIAIALALVGGVWYAVAGPGAYTDTPAMVSQRQDEAQRSLANAGLKGDFREVFDDKVAKGQVVRSDPQGGADVRKGGTVVVFVSKGPEIVEVPNLAGKPADEARKAITDAGLRLGEPSAKYSDDVDEGKVIGTTPKAGTKLAPDRQVVLIVSRGPKPFEVVDFVGKKRDEVEAAIKGRGLNLVVQDTGYQFPFGPLPGTVTAQDPAPGSELKKGDKLTITVVKLLPGQTAAVTVPNVTGWNLPDAEAELRNRGLNVKVERTGFGEQVQGQNPTGDQQVAQGSEVTLWVG